MSKTGAIAKMAVSAVAYHIDKPYDYLIPESLRDAAVPGMRALVPFGRGSKKREAVILSLTADSRHDGLKSIDSFLDAEPVFSAESLRLALWMSDRFFCTVFDALRSMLPAGMLYKESGKRLGDKVVGVAVLNLSLDDAAALSEQKRKRAPKQAAVLERIRDAGGSVPVKELCALAGATLAVVKTLEKQGIISIEEREVFRRPNFTLRHFRNDFEPNSEQLGVLGELTALLQSGKPEAALLYGVTGSGKTIIYIKLIEAVIALGKTAIALVPEIALTPQTVSIFSSFFGDSVAVIHSALGSGERYDEWKRIRSGEVRVVVGTRSAIFAPLSEIGLIVLDEEQEHTYKSENSPRYHAREIAKYRVAQAGALLLLSSATPSVESMYAASTGRFRLLRMNRRFNEKELPQVVIADMRAELKNGNDGSISSVLRKELEHNILLGEQSILFINRRGTNPLVACCDCGYTFRCRYCSVSMTYHASNRRLLCHYCDFTQPLPQDCPECGGSLKFLGAGTQRVESELEELFPGISIVRMDADAVTRVNSHDKLLSRFRDSRAQVLLGTQMVTKGLDFENVTLVGVLSADSSLYMSDFRAHEKTFSLITQVVGRSGRGEKPGRAVIQTFTPSHDVLLMAARQDFDGFYEREIAVRQALGSPPVSELMAITVTGKSEPAVIAACRKLCAALSGYFRGDEGIRLLGPSPAAVAKVNDRFRYRLFVNGENSKRVRETIAHTIKEFLRSNQSRGLTVYAETE